MYVVIKLQPLAEPVVHYSGSQQQCLAYAFTEWNCSSLEQLVAKGVFVKPVLY